MSTSYEEKKSILCRLCLQELEYGIDIFTYFPKIRLPAKMIAELLQTCVSQEDEYPQKVCHECFKKLLKFYSMSNRNDLSTYPEFVLFKEQCKIAASTVDYIKEKAESDGQHTPLSMDHSPLNLKLEDLGMDDEEEVVMKQDPCVLLEAVAGILKSIRCSQIGSYPGNNEENVSEDEYSLDCVPGEERKFPKFDLERSGDSSDLGMKTFSSSIGERKLEMSLGNATDSFRETRSHKEIEPESRELSRREELRRRNRPGVPAKAEKSPKKLSGKYSINDLKRHRIPRRAKQSSGSTSSFTTDNSYADSKPVEIRSMRDEGRWSGGDLVSSRFPPKEIKYNTRRVLVAEKLHECALCGRVFVLPSDLLNHSRNYHRSDVKETEEEAKRINGTVIKQERFDPSDPSVCQGDSPKDSFSCDGCGTVFDKVGQLEVHLIRHFDEENLKCNICDVKFRHYRYMKRHLVRHLRIKRFSCDQCGKRFGKFTDLRLHSAVHSRETPFVCARCGKAFRSRMLLKVHEKIHDPVKPHGCDLCGTTFVQKSDLVKHRAVHTRERNHVCAICGKTYLHKRNLKQHERSHYSAGYVCSYCGKAYRDIRNLRAHITYLFLGGKKIRNCKVGRTKKPKPKLQVVIK